MARIGDGGPAAAPAARRGNFLGRASIQDPFAILGLKQSASSEQITCAYRSLARRYHPDKDRSVPSHLATARFQRIRAAYDLLSDERKRKAAAASSISAPFKPSAAWRAQQRRAAGHAGPVPPRKKVKPMRFKPARKKKIKPQNPPAAEEEKELPKEAKQVDVVEILDSDDEVRAAPPAARLPPRRPAAVRAAEGDDCRRLQSRAAAKRRALERRHGQAVGEERSAAEETEEVAGKSFARLVFRSGKGRISEILAEDLLAAFPGAEAMWLANRVELQKLLRPLFKTDACENKVCAVKKRTKNKDICNLRDAHIIRAVGLLGKTKRRGLPLQKGKCLENFAKGLEVILLQPSLAVLSFPTQKQAVACALSFHGWPSRAPPERELCVLRQLSLVVAPVNSNGCAHPGPKTLVVSRTRVAAADGRTAGILSVEGFLPTADVAFLDEVFKANSSILNALLTLLNERIFDNGGERIDVPLPWPQVTLEILVRLKRGKA
ncbi:hypothetical protein AK812_SmicGene23371 [Symbiodinium microadriaticum]|uniref:J domain-containing protein n=1 Tax=Symbiodinium microadriaticum TaxID=2951 RepID=A0A1Q9DHF4_SYMMI|nr:hypothetical protein AK812_SmicGene23371 [Symbiodinium microadriaticum]